MDSDRAARQELGRRVAAAVVGHISGIKSVDYFIKHYIGEKEVGPFWCDLGDYLVHAVLESKGSSLAPDLEFMKPITEKKQ